MFDSYVFDKYIVCLNFPVSVFEGINYFCHDMVMLAPAIVVNKYILFYSMRGISEPLGSSEYKA